MHLCVDAQVNERFIMEGFSSMSIFWIVIVFALVLLALKGIKQVPQSKVVLVERLGKYTKTLHSGINFIIPFLDTTPHEPIDISEQQLSIAKQNVTSSDNVRILLDIQAFYRITDAAHFKYRIEKGAQAIRTTIDATVRALVGRRTLDQLNADRLQLATEIAEEVRNTSSEWGVAMNRVEITDIQVVDEEFADSMRKQATAERERRATIITAEADAQRIKLEAEANALQVRVNADALLYKAQKEAEAIRVTAEAQAWALTTKGSSLETDGAKFAQQSEILRAQVDALHSLGGADNSKIVVIPTDLIQTAATLTNLLRR
jgi:regulator of protease activity HflC (stomatin/prohibitin superfamily)